MSQLGITAYYKDNRWTIKHGNCIIEMPVTFKTPDISQLILSYAVSTHLVSNTCFSKAQAVQLLSVVYQFSLNIVSDANNLPEAAGFEHEINTGNSNTIAGYPY